MLRQPPCPHTSSDGPGILVIENGQEILRFDGLWPFALIQEDQRTLKLFPSNVEPWEGRIHLN